jgi:hypothetical protein
VTASSKHGSGFVGGAWPVIAHESTFSIQCFECVGGAVKSQAVARLAPDLYDCAALGQCRLTISSATGTADGTTNAAVKPKDTALSSSVVY